jgi:hypothetical protein
LFNRIQGKSEMAKIGDLTDSTLDWAVAKCEGKNYTDKILDIEFSTISNQMWAAGGCSQTSNYSSNWNLGGPIIEREHIAIRSWLHESKLFWWAWDETGQGKTGQTPLIAAMRCYVASKLGQEVEIPEDLL